MSRRGHILRAALATGCAVSALWTGISAASGSYVKVGHLVLTADGGFLPQKLPRHKYAPIEFKGHADIRSTNSEPPPLLSEATIDFDHDGLLQTRGLPTCRPAKIAHVKTPAARKRCGDAEVGDGTIGATLYFEGAAFPIHAPLTLFNAPRIGGDITVLAHTHIASPLNKTFVIPVRVETRRGEYRYRARFDVPSIAGGGVLDHVDVKIGRRYEFHGHERSFVSARCSDGIFRTHGHFLFEDGTVIDGAIEKPCVPNNF